MKKAYHFNPETLIFAGVSNVYKITGYEHYILPQFATWLPLPTYNADAEQCQYDTETKGWTIESKLVSVDVFNKQTRELKRFDDKALVSDDYTQEKPSTQFDEWIDEAWITNLSDKYIHEYDQVDTTRRGLYSQRCDPLISEANIKRLQGEETEAKELEAQALAAWQNIHDEHTWPERPEQ